MTTFTETLDFAVLYGLVQAHSLANLSAPFCGFIAGFSAVKAFTAFSADEKGWLSLWGGLLATSIVLGPGAWFLLPELVKWFRLTGGELPDWQLWVHCVGFLVGVASVFAWGRYGVPKLEGLKHRATRRSDLERNRRTDVREIGVHLPDPSHDFDPLRYLDASKGVFIGLDEHQKPLYVPQSLWRRSHAQLIGTTGAGKGVTASLLLAQAVRDGEAVIVLDPKDDEWAPHVLKAECERLGVPFVLVDLRLDQPQIDLIDSATPDQLEELLVAGFSLSEKGEAADFYRIGDRRAARVCANLLNDLEPGESCNIAALASHPDIRSQSKEAAGFLGKIDELARVTAINGATGHLSKTVESGGCLYVIGSMRSERVKIAQRMLLVRLLQLVESRDRVKNKPRSVCCFLDELKYHLSRPALEGLGAARDKGLHLVLAHQSLSDLQDCPADLDGDAVVGAVVENCAIRIAYKIRDPETAKWLASMSGTILVDDETRKIERNVALTEVVDAQRSVRQAERFLVDENMLLNLPDRVAVVYGKGLPVFAHVCPFKTEKKDILAAVETPIEAKIHIAPFSSSNQSEGDYESWAAAQEIDKPAEQYAPPKKRTATPAQELPDVDF